MGDRPVSRQELMRCNGERGRPRYVAFAGVVYDLSRCPNWRTELHRDLHFAGQDLTAELAQAPHDAEVFQRPCVRRIGPLVP
jgi:predicted heme/steroid binding protein